MYERLNSAADAVCRLLEFICNAMLVVMTAIIVVLILSRNIWSFSFSWSEELTRFLLVWLCMLGATVLLHRDDHIKLELLSGMLPPKGRVALDLVLRLLVLAFLVILLPQAWRSMLARAVTHAPASGVSMSIPYAAIPVAAVLMLFVTVIGLWRDVLRLAGRLPLPAPRTEP